MILEKLNQKIEKLKTKIKLSLTKPVLSEPDVELIYVIAPIDEANHNFTFICKRFYSVFLKFFLKWRSIATFNPIPHIQKQTFLKILKIMKTTVKNLILN